MNLATRFFTLGLGMAALACGTEPSGDTITVDGGAKPVSDAGGACDAAVPAACTCAGDGGGLQSGTQHCYQGQWLACNCYAAPITAPTAAQLGGFCKPGRYEGDFSGLYTSSWTFVGVPIPVVALNPAGPGLAFTLNATETGAGEFTELTVSDGFVKGAADGAFPFDGVLTGTLDCNTKTFTGSLKGRYCVGPCVGVNEVEFDGPITGNYDGTTFAFTNGTWDLVELKVQMGLFGNFGGNGEWKATWVGEGQVDLDSGVTTSGADAGP